ncbi:hypothetical protein DOY81_010457 [Sarcophaga bullata]|nr:hypothetical protein DOY81_010457 [Sarcophaga bullata]
MVFNDFSTDSPVSSMPRRPHSTSHQHNQKYAVVDISFDDPEADQAPHSLTHTHNCHNSDLNHLNVTFAPNDFRDSGISTTSAHELNHLSNLSEESSTNSLSTVHHRDHCRLSSNGSVDGSYAVNNSLNINQRENSTSSFDLEEVPMPPPPIPPKSLNIIGTHESSIESVPSTPPPPPLSSQAQPNANHSHLHHHHHHHLHQQQQQQQNGHNDGYISPKATPVAVANENNEFQGEVGNTF